MNLSKVKHYSIKSIGNIINIKSIRLVDFKNILLLYARYAPQAGEKTVAPLERSCP